MPLTYLVDTLHTRRQPPGCPLARARYRLSRTYSRTAAGRIANNESSVP